MKEQSGYESEPETVELGPNWESEAKDTSNEDLLEKGLVQPEDI